jgi:hypothetical protein
MGFDVVDRVAALLVFFFLLVRPVLLVKGSIRLRFQGNGAYDTYYCAAGSSLWTVFGVDDRVHSSSQLMID